MACWSPQAIWGGCNSGESWSNPHLASSWFSSCIWDKLLWKTPQLLPQPSELMTLAPCSLLPWQRWLVMSPVRSWNFKKSSTGTLSWRLSCETESRNWCQGLLGKTPKLNPQPLDPGPFSPTWFSLVARNNRAWKIKGAVPHLTSWRFHGELRN